MNQEDGFSEDNLLLKGHTMNREDSLVDLQEDLTRVHVSEKIDIHSACCEDIVE